MIYFDPQSSRSYTLVNKYVRVPEGNFFEVNSKVVSICPQIASLRFRATNKNRVRSILPAGTRLPWRYYRWGESFAKESSDFLFLSFGPPSPQPHFFLFARSTCPAEPWCFDFKPWGKRFLGGRCDALQIACHVLSVDLLLWIISTGHNKAFCLPEIRLCLQE